MITRRLVLGLPMWVALTTSATAEAKDSDAVRLARRIEDLYDAAKTFRADFRQTFRHAKHDKKVVTKGRMAAANGGKLSFRYDNGDRVVSDGDIVKAYDKKAKRLYQMRLKRAKHAFAVSFMMGKISLVNSFRLRLIDKERKKVKKHFVLEAIPKRNNPAVARLVLYVDAKTAQVKRVLLIDAQGNSNRFDLTKRRFGAKLPKGEFRFKPPKGTKVIKP